MPSPPVALGAICDCSLTHSLLLERAQWATATDGPLASPTVAVLMCSDPTGCGVSLSPLSTRLFRYFVTQ